MPQSSTTTDFAFDSLDSIRKRLLDLTTRNTLLSYRFPKGSSLRLIDELPDQIISVLKEGKPLTFLPIPEPRESELIEAGYSETDEETGKTTIPEYPSAAEWAKHLGFATSYDLPEEPRGQPHTKHADDNLQTLLYRPELDARLRSLMSKSRTAIEESGVNVLFLNIGYLTWYESRESDTVRWAPLYSIPVKLERLKSDLGKGAHSYQIKVVDDSLLPNLTLSEKLANDFGLSLPEVTDDIKPEAYLRLVESKISSHEPRWAVRRQATLSLLNYAKQVIYEDLDPSNWPEDSKIEQIPNVRMFFESIESDSSAGANTYLPEHDIDTLPNVHEKYPIVFKADSSQHSALIDAIEGKNLVIEGPPGTGKSQTIANLIAASIGNNKKVLFVAEKMAALEVVKSRLESVGLGDFCLELHSHKANKAAVLSSLESRLKQAEGYHAPKIADEIVRFEALKDKLTDYVEFVNTPWKKTGLTPHQILNKATRLREENGIDPKKLAISQLDGATYDPARRLELLDRAKMLASIFRQISEQAPGGDITKHYWFGTNSTRMTEHETSECFDELEKWKDSLRSLESTWQRWAIDVLGEDKPEVLASLEKCQTTFATLRELPALDGSEPVSQLDFVVEHLDDYHWFLKTYLEIHKKISDLKKRVASRDIDNPQTPKNWRAAIDTLQDLGAPSSFSVRSLNASFGHARDAMSLSDRVAAAFGDIRPKLPAELAALVETSVSGIKEFQTAIAVVEQLPADLLRFRSEKFENEDVDDYLVSLEPLLEQLKLTHDDLIDVYALHRLPDSETLRKYYSILESTPFYKRLGGEYRVTKKAVGSLAANKSVKTKRLLSTVHRLIEYQEVNEKITSLNRINEEFKELFDGIETPIERHKQIREWYKLVFAEYGFGFGERTQISTALTQLDRNLLRSIVDYSKQGLGEDTQTLTQLIELIRQNFPKARGLRSEADDFASTPSPLQKLRDELSTTKEQLTGLISSASNLTEILDLSERLSDLNQLKQRWTESQITARLVPEHLALSLHPEEWDDGERRNASTLLKVGRLISNNEEIRNYLKEDTAANYERLTTSCQSVTPDADAELAARDKVSILEVIDIETWLKPTEGQFEATIQKNERALQQRPWLTTWQDYQEVRERLENDGVDAILRALEANDISHDKLVDVVELVALHQVASEMFEENDLLASFSGLEQNAIRERFREYDQEIQKLQCEQIAYLASRTPPEPGVSTGRVSNYTESSLILHEAGKKRAHVAIRSLMERAQKSIQAIKPCFMMSPMSVAQYLPQGIYEFDLVVMDEASQIRPEDAIGSIARGNNIVVVGDPKQLPPTSFFQKVIDDDDDSDSVALEESESILESVIPMFRNRRLRWHYRSRHEKLIAFSNQHFYDSNLVLFPTPHRESEDLGIKWNSVQRGRFSNRRNVVEAQAVVSDIVHHLLSSTESIAVVAMNSDQRDEIERQLELEVKENPALRRAYDKDSERADSLIIKNLENIQGDERDVVVISLTYGPDQVGGRVMQRFGPINRDTGWRRLNVLFTRAKKRMHVFSSMRSTDILTDQKSSRGLHALRGFLEYCESGRLVTAEHTGASPESDFEIAVINALKKHGYDCEPQLGVAGFYLDLAVKDPGNPGAFLLGVECDGASYHSAKSARDRDVLRQEILESLGWKIRRIWSTDWFKNPEAQLQPILTELEALKTPIFDSAPLPPEDNLFENNVQLREVDLDTNQSLRELLVELDVKVIRPQNPEVDEDARLLRPAMLEALLNHLPCSKAEFVEVVPQYLREGTSPKEGKFLDQVVLLIAEHA